MDTRDTAVYSFMEGEQVSILESLPSKTIHGFFDYMVDSMNPDVALNPAIIHNDIIMTFAELKSLSNKMAYILKERLRVDIDKTSVIGIHVRPSQKLMVLLLAIMKTGAAYVPLDPEYPIPRLQHIISDSQPVFVLASPGTLLMNKEAVPRSNDMDSDYDVICIDDVWDETVQLDHGSVLQETTVAGDGDKNKNDNLLACILYTSGRTGIPKGVCLSHRSILHRLAWQWTAFPMNADDIGCLKTTLNFVDSLAEIFGFILQGRPVVIIDRDIVRDPEQLINTICRYKVTRITVVPSLLIMILAVVSNPDCRKKIHDVAQTLKMWICSGEELSHKLVKQFISIFPECILVNFYGSTEVTGDVTYITFNKTTSLGIGSQVPIGRPLYNTNVYILDDDKKIVPIGEAGHIYISGENLAVGYLNDEEEKSQSFLQCNIPSIGINARLYKMGDLGRMVCFGDKEKHLTLLFEGSGTSHVKLRGQRISLREIENSLHEIEGIDVVRVRYFKESLSNQSLVAFCTVKKNDCTGYTLSSDDIKTALEKRFPAYMIPMVIIVQDWPVLPNGKINNEALKEIFCKRNSHPRDNTESNSHTCENTGPKDDKLYSPTYTTLVNVISETLLISSEQIDHQCDFFTLGGNSVNAVEAVSKLQTTGLHITLAEFISSTSVLDIAKKLHKSKDLSSIGEQRSISDVLKGVEITSLGDFEIIHFSQASDIEKDTALAFVSEEAIMADPILKSLSDSGIAPKNIFKELYKLFDEVLGATTSLVLSFFVKEKTSDRIVGVYIAHSGYDDKEIDEHTMPICYMIFSFMDLLLKDTYPAVNISYGNNYVAGEMIAVGNVPAKVKLDLTMMMEKHLYDTARSEGYKSVWCFNNNPVTQMVCCEMGYTVRQRRPVRSFCHNGKYVFEKVQPADLELQFVTKDIM